MNFASLKRGLKKCILALPIIRGARKKYLKYIRSCYDYTLKPPTIICSTCIGGMISHNLGLRFMSPTINLWMMPSDLTKFVCDLDKYLSADMEFIRSNCYEYPVGRLDDITIYFQHYKSNAEALEKWNERKKRIDKDNIYIITDDKRLSDKEAERLENAKCKRLIIFTNKEEKNKNYFRFECYKNSDEIGKYSVRDLFGFAPFEREFNYAAWLSGSSNYAINKGEKYEK